MSSYIDVPEQLCYIPCNFCNIVLAVSVPCSNLFDMVTVRCGHCSNLWSVNMAAAAFQLQQLQAKLSSILETKPQEMATLGSLRSAAIFLTDSAPNYAASERKIDFGSSSKCNNKMAMSLPPISTSTEQRIVNRPPEKRQRVPSAYNQFIKEEIQRIKANNPEISHREAFSTAAKNWAHFPHIHFGLMLESNNQPKRGF